jgi:outer membrane receptor protein involved in Fe transport
MTPRLGLRADVISGDSNASDGRLGTFNPLFPKGAYFGEIALIGPANLFDLHPSLDLHVTEHVKVSLDWDVFWRYDTADGLYDPGGNVLRPPAGSGARFVGNQPSIGVDWDLGRHTTLSASYAHFFAGDFIKQSGPGKDVDFVAAWLIYRF